MRLAHITRFAAAALVCASALAVPAASAQQSIYTATLFGANEVPPVASPGFGAAIVTIDLGLRTMNVLSSFASLVGTTTVAHIHCCTTPGMIAPVATQTPTFMGFPTGVTSGTYNMTFDMTQASSYNPAFIAANGGTVTSAFNSFVAGLDASLSYFNIHSTFAPGGEIRGQLAPIPEPATVLLMIGGLAAVGAVVRVRSRRG